MTDGEKYDNECQWIRTVDQRRLLFAQSHRMGAFGIAVGYVLRLMTWPAFV